MFNKQIENNSLSDAKNLKVEVADLINLTEEMRTESDVEMMESQIGEIFYRHDIKDPNNSDEVSKKPLLIPLFSVKDKLIKEGEYTHEKIDKAKEGLKAYLEDIFGVIQVKPKKGEVMDIRSGYKVVDVKKTNDPALDRKIVEAKPGYRINDELWNYYQGEYREEFNKERQRKEKVLEEIVKKEGRTEAFDNAYEKLAKWKNSHTFPKEIRAPWVTIYKSEKE